MILALDVGNTRMHGGVFEGEALKACFGAATPRNLTAREISAVLGSALHESGVDAAPLRRVAIASVVPEIESVLREACRGLFHVDPFLLHAGSRTGLTIRYHRPEELGADRIANAIAAVHRYPGSNLVVADFGTATTYEIVGAGREILGGLILPGFRTAADALHAHTSKLPAVEIVRPPDPVGRSTVEGIQSGLYQGALHTLRGIVEDARNRVFAGRPEPLRVIGTGGFAALLEPERVFDAVIPELTLIGLRCALEARERNDAL